MEFGFNGLDSEADWLTVTVDKFCVVKQPKELVTVALGVKLPADVYVYEKPSTLDEVPVPVVIKKDWSEPEPGVQLPLKLTLKGVHPVVGVKT